MIPPAHQTIYDWEFSENEEEAFVTITFPKIFNPEVIKFELNEEKTAIIITMESPIPIVCGLLWGPVTSAKNVFTSEKYVLSLTKANNETWPMLIKAMHPDNNAMDPKSAFVVFQDLAKVAGNQDISELAYNFIVISAQTGFLPALRTFGVMLLKVKGQEQAGFTALKTAADTYGDAQASYHIGLILASTAEGFTNGISYLKQAAQKGFSPAYLTLGQIYSPFTPFDAPKEPQLAVQYLTQAVEEDSKLSQVYMELSKFYAAGVGVEKDLNKAQELMQKGELLEEKENRRRYSTEQEPIVIEEKPKEGSISTLGKIAIAGAVSAFFAGFCFAIYKKMTRQ